MTPEYQIETEQRIKEYLAGYDISEVKHLQVEQTFDDLGIEVNIWNARTNNGNWWVAEGEGVPMNLYPQSEFYFSADEAYSFHMGITQRLHSSRENDFKHVIDEIPLDIENFKSVSRRLNNASVQLNNISGPEDIQSVGLTCRESLIELAGILAEGNPDLLKENDLKAADFKGIAKAIISLYAQGKSNSKLRKRCRELIEAAWDQSCEVVHSPNKNFPDAKITLHFTCLAVSIIQNLFLKYIGYDGEPKCPECNSLDHEILCAENSHALVFHCNKCDFEETIENEK